MEGNTEEVHIGSERELYKYINIHAGTPPKVRGRQMLSTDIQNIWTTCKSSGMQYSEVIEKIKCSRTMETEEGYIILHRTITRGHMVPFCEIMSCNDGPIVCSWIYREDGTVQ